MTFHLYCLHHLGGNVTDKLRPILRTDWEDFLRDFWVVYHAVSPNDFDEQWRALCTRYPATAKYLDEELYPCRSHWAWAWVGSIFTAGVRTTGRAEGENRVNKMIGGPKKSFLQLFEGLNQRSDEQATNNLIQVRQAGVFLPSESFTALMHILQSSRRRHESNLESLFLQPLKLIRQYGGPFALQKCHEQMQQSLFYSTHPVIRPSETTSWVSVSSAFGTSGSSYS